MSSWEDEVQENDNIFQCETASSSKVSESDVECGCCFQLLVEPTSLQCGHSFCRLCLAQWYLQSRKASCPTCKQSYQGCPRVNIILRNIIEKSYPSEAKARYDEVWDAGARNKVKDFEKAFSGNQFFANQGMRAPVDHRQGRDFCHGILFAGAVLTVIYLAYYWRNSDRHLLIYKPVERWGVADVHQWMSEFGLWSQPYAQQALDQQIDGRLLLEMENEDVEHYFNITDTLHFKAIIRSIDTIRNAGKKIPATIWEFKSLHQGLSLILLYGLKDCPRTTLFYLYLLEYDTVFFPFVQYVSPSLDESAPSTLTLSQYLDLLPKCLILPYWPIAYMAYDFSTVHFWTSKFVLVNCLLLSMIECSYFLWFVKGGYREARQLLKNYAKSLFSALCFIIIWPVIPSFICDCFFYIALYFSPYVSAEALYKLLVQQVRR